MGNHVRHLTVNGSALTSGGTFHKVTIRGDATINGDLWCDRCKVFGNADVSGNIEAKSFHIFGQANIRGNVQGETIKLFGEINIRGNAIAHDFHLRGAAHVDGNVTGGTIHGYGEMKVSRDCEADMFSVKGAVEIGSTLNAEQVELYLHFADSRITEIGGKTIRVKRSKTLNILHFLKRFARDSAKLVTETIEGDDIYLEHTDAKIVRGDRIIIGPGCNIGLVEYHTSFQQDEKAIVKEKRKR
ncbi:polymer-forming cytoskeletal protein [Thermolongibacillus altinsuensis]